MFIVSITYTAPLEIIDRHIAAHIDYLEAQYQLGNFQLSGRKVPRTGGVILATVAGRGELDRILGQDPFFREKLAVYEVTEFVPTKSSPALGFLVGEQANR